MFAGADGEIKFAIRAFEHARPDSIGIDKCPLFICKEFTDSVMNTVLRSYLY